MGRYIPGMKYGLLINYFELNPFLFVDPDTYPQDLNNTGLSKEDRCLWKISNLKPLRKSPESFGQTSNFPPHIFRNRFRISADVATQVLFIQSF